VRGELRIVELADQHGQRGAGAAALVGRLALSSRRLPKSIEETLLCGPGPAHDAFSIGSRDGAATRAPRPVTRSASSGSACDA